MKRIIYTFAMCVLAMGLGSCHKDLMDYEGVDGLYFDVQWGSKGHGDSTVWSHQIYTPIEFGRIDESVVTKRFKVAVAGSVVNYDRPFVLEVVADSTTAREGEDYEFITKDFVIPAGLNHKYVEVKFYKTARMAEETCQLQMMLRPNEYFTTPFSEVGTIPGRWDNDMQTIYSTNDDPRIHNVFINDMLTKPSAWHQAKWGNFSVKKYDLILRLSYESNGYTKKDFDGEEANSKMLSGRADLIARITSKFLEEQWSKGRDNWVIDEDGTMMWVFGVKHWTAGLKPEEVNEP